ncbi:MAG: YbhB/YbcL family Raf kinase inhibitor-like protein [Myxococcota bacterium]
MLVLSLVALVMVGCTGDDPKADSAPEMDADTDADSDSDTDADTDSDTDADADADTDADTDADPVVFTLSSPDMVPHTALPCEQQLPQAAECMFFGGDNLNPRLEWTGVPAGTVTLALLFDDVDFQPTGDPFDHWGVYDIPPTASFIEQGASGTGPTGTMPAGSQQVASYEGSCSDGNNTYRWRLVALDAALPSPASSLADIEAFAATHTLGEAVMCHCNENQCTSF